MLRKILDLLASGDTRTLESLAGELGIESAEVEDMLMRLCALGYIEELAAAAAGICGDGERKTDAGCSACGMASSCGQAPKGRVWALMPKGRKNVRTHTHSLDRELTRR